MFINQQFIETLSNFDSVKYLFDFTTLNFTMFLATGDTDTVLSDKLYEHGVSIKNISINNLSSTDDIMIQTLNIYNKKTICIEALLRSKVVIKIFVKNSKTDQIATIFNGFVSKILEDNDVLNITISPIISCLNQSVGELFSPICRECLGSAKCGVNLNDYKTSGYIVNLISDDCFYGSHQNDKQTQVGYYDYGLIKFLSGSLRGISMQIKSEKKGTVYLLRNTKLLSVNDKYEIYAGCNKTITTCKNKFNNVVNFRGEPYIETNN